MINSWFPVIFLELFSTHYYHVIMQVNQFKVLKKNRAKVREFSDQVIFI